MSAWAYVAAILGCGVGAVMRYAIGTWRREHHLPWPTLAANALGTLVLGAAAALLEEGQLSATSAFVIGSGLAGGLTTFSTLAVDAVVLWRTSPRKAVLYLAVTGAVGVASGALGWAVAAAAVN